MVVIAWYVRREDMHESLEVVRLVLGHTSRLNAHLDDRQIRRRPACDRSSCSASLTAQEKSWVEHLERAECQQKAAA